MENVQFLFIIAKMNSKNLKTQKINIFFTALLKIFVVPTQHKLTSQYNTIQRNTITSEKNCHNRHQVELISSHHSQ